MIAGSVVNEPCPISAAGDTMVMVPSVAIVIQTFGAKEDCASASPVTSSCGLTAKAKVNPALPLRKSRRLICVFMAQPSRAARWIALMMPR